MNGVRWGVALILIGFLVMLSGAATAGSAVFQWGAAISLAGFAVAAVFLGVSGMRGGPRRRGRGSV